MSSVKEKTSFPSDPDEKNPEYIQNYFKEFGEDLHSSCPNWIPPNRPVNGEKRMDEGRHSDQQGLELFNSKSLFRPSEKKPGEHCHNRY